MKKYATEGQLAALAEEAGAALGKTDRRVELLETRLNDFEKRKRRHTDDPRAVMLAEKTDVELARLQIRFNAFQAKLEERLKAMATKAGSTE